MASVQSVVVKLLIYSLVYPGDFHTEKHKGYRKLFSRLWNINLILKVQKRTCMVQLEGLTKFEEMQPDSVTGGVELQCTAK